jgi:Hemopexin
MKISAVLTTPFPLAKAYFFRSPDYIQYDIALDRADPGYPQAAAADWPGTWNAGFDTGASTGIYAYFFKGDQYVRVNLLTRRPDEGYPKLIAADWHGVWKDGIDAVVFWNADVAYFFKNDQYIRYDLKAEKTVDGYPKAIASTWPGLWKDGIDSAVVWNNGKAYFFKGDQYIRYDIAADRSDPGYPMAIAGNWPGVVPVSAKTSFDPAKNGFKFANSFNIDPRLFGSKGKTWSFGLCGGMCSGALERWTNKEPIPDLTHVPQQKCPELDLFWELFGRQAFTLFPDVWLEVALWQASPDVDTTIPAIVPGSQPIKTTGLGTRTASQWPKLKELLDKGIAAVIVLIRAKGEQDPSENHQVVAIGYEMPTLYDIHVQIYDPNHPGETQELRFNLSDPANKNINGTETDGKTFRGFFIDMEDGRPYTPAQPTPA